jgi:hypothetical protein
MRAKEFIIEFQIPKNTWTVLPDPTAATDELVGLVNTAYSSTDLGSFVNSESDVSRSDWAVLDWDSNPDIDSTIFFRGPRIDEKWTGHKIQGVGHNGHPESKRKAVNFLLQTLNKDGWWIESSGAMSATLLKIGAPIVTDSDTIKSLFNDNSIQFISDTIYTRVLSNGHKIKESVFGKPAVE